VARRHPLRHGRRDAVPAPAAPRPRKRRVCRGLRRGQGARGPGQHLGRPTRRPSPSSVDLPGTTFTPPGHWNRVAQTASLERGLGPRRQRPLFAVLDAALADARSAAGTRNTPTTSGGR
jgi:hypothetical protein